MLAIINCWKICVCAAILNWITWNFEWFYKTAGKIAYFPQLCGNYCVISHFSLQNRWKYRAFPAILRWEASSFFCLKESTENIVNISWYWDGTCVIFHLFKHRNHASNYLNSRVGMWYQVKFEECLRFLPISIYWLLWILCLHCYKNRVFSVIRRRKLCHLLCSETTAEKFVCMLQYYSDYHVVSYFFHCFGAKTMYI